MTSKPSYGVIVGRFQVHELHEGHLELFRVVGSLHHRVIVFLGSTRVGPTRHNPLDFDTRRLMIQAKFPNYMVLPLQDQPNDAAWSMELDRSIADVVTFGSATLYGSRDSFVPHYRGKHGVKELELVVPPTISGTLAREQISDTVLSSTDFRAGCMYTVGQQFVRCFPTVHVALFRQPATTAEPGNASLLLRRKAGEAGWKFIGGYAEAEDESYEATVLRELSARIDGIKLANLKYICSQKLDNWRYHAEADKVKTIFFSADCVAQRSETVDPSEELKWANLGDLTTDDFGEEHRGLYSKLIESLPAHMPNLAKQEGAG